MDTNNNSTNNTDIPAAKEDMPIYEGLEQRVRLLEEALKKVGSRLKLGDHVFTLERLERRLCRLESSVDIDPDFQYQPPEWSPYSDWDWE